MNRKYLRVYLNKDEVIFLEHLIKYWRMTKNDRYNRCIHKCLMFCMRKWYEQE